ASSTALGRTRVGMRTGRTAPSVERNRSRDTRRTPMSNVTIIGGHGKVALLLAPLLTERADTVTSIFRNPDHTAEVAQTGANTVVADVEQLSVEELAELLRGSDVVVWSAGAGGGNPQRTWAVDRDAAIRTIDAAERAGVRRFVMV